MNALKGPPIREDARQRYTVIGRLSTTPSAEILLGTQDERPAREKLVALKRMRGSAARRSAFALLSHLKAVRGVAHPHVARLHGYFRKDRDIVAILEYVDGDSLSHLSIALRRSGERLPLPIWARIAIQLCGAISVFAGGGTVSHRRLTPDHVLLDSRGYVKLIGAASAVCAEPNELRTELGTLPYRAPDFFRHSDVDARAEVYSLGSVLWSLLSGRPPFTGTSAMTTPELVDKVLYQKLPPLRALGVGVPPELDVLLAWAMAKQRDQRCPSPIELAQAIRRLAEKFGGVASVTETTQWYSDLMGERLQMRRAFEDRAFNRLSTIPPLASCATNATFGRA